MIGEYDMKKLINTAFLYAILGLIAGVFYREFTKFVGFEGYTTLSVLHTHFFTLGMFFFLIAALFEKALGITKNPKFKLFYLSYNIGFASMITMLAVRGITLTLQLDLSSGMNAAISGLSGLAHIILTVGIMYFFTILRKEATN